MRLTVVVPTLGRPTLLNTLRSIDRQARPGDRVLVMADGPSPMARSIFKPFGRRGGTNGRWVYEEHRHLGCYGHPLRNIALEREHGRHVATIDDDDVYLPGALDAIRESACARPVIFRMRMGRDHPARGVTVWHDPRVAYGNVGTPMVVAPACGARFGLEYGGDLVYAEQAVAVLGPPIFHERVIALIRPGKEEL